MVWLLLALVAVVGLVAAYAVVHRAHRGRADEPQFDLLTVPWLRRLLTAPAFQPALQIPFLALMVVVVWLGLGDVQDGGVNLATKLTWTIWWAGVIFTFVLLGRGWCVACPFGALNEWTARLAGAARRLPRPFRNIWWATGPVRAPDLGGRAARRGALTAGDGLDRAVLRGAGSRRGARLRAAELLPGSVPHRRGDRALLDDGAGRAPAAGAAAPCAADRDKPCYRGNAATPGCPMFEFPGALDRNNYCTLCARVRDGLQPRQPGTPRPRPGQGSVGGDAKDAGRGSSRGRPGGPHAAGDRADAERLARLGLGARASPPDRRAVEPPAGDLSRAGRVGPAPRGALVIGPLLVLGSAALADRLAGSRLGLRRTFIVFGYVLVPVGLAMHLAHNLAHLLLEGGGIVPAVQRAVALYTPFCSGPRTGAPRRSLRSRWWRLLQVAIVVAFFGLSLVAGHRLALRTYPDARTASRAFLPMAGIALVFTLVGLVVLSLPMGMRHGS